MTAERMPAPLEGVRVLELAVLLAAPYVGMILRDFGADVTKVEDPRGGDQMRTWPPSKNGMSLIFARVNAGKRSVAIDLRAPEGQAVVRDLVRDSDVVLENFRPGRLESWGLGWEQLHAINPRMVMVRVSGYGQTGKDRDRPGFGPIAESEAGLAYITGHAGSPPSVAPFGMGDAIAAMAASFGAVLGLRSALVTGEGRQIDVALYEPIVAMLGDVILRYTVTGDIQQRGQFNLTAPRGVYRTGDDRWLMISGSSQSVVERLFRAMGRPELIRDPRFATNESRVANREEVEDVVVRWVASQTRSELLGTLRDHHVAAGPVNDARDVANDPVFRERGSIYEVESETLGRVLYPGTILTVTGLDRPPYVDAPRLGQHTVDVLRLRLGMTTERIEELARDGIVALE